MSAQPNAHAKKSASAAERWMTCPGSVALAAKYPSTNSEPAVQGTFAHTIAASALTMRSRDISHWLGSSMMADGFTVKCDQEMIDGIGVYLDAIEEDTRPEDLTYVEVDLTPALSKLHPDLGGTADFVRYRPSTRALRVWDFKYGAGVMVDADDNKQLKIYALGALLATGFGARTVTVTIAQPRIDVPEGMIRGETFAAVDLIDFKNEVVDAAIACDAPNAPLIPSTNGCKWCPARHACPELEKRQHALAAVEFTALANYDPVKLSQALDMIPLVEARIKALHEFAYLEAERGNPPPGYKLVDKRATRKWVNEEAVVAALEGVADTHEPPSLKSPAQLEKLVGKKIYTEKLKEYVIQESSGRTLVHESDRRPAVGPKVTAADFTVIEGAAKRIEDKPLTILGM